MSCCQAGPVVAMGGLVGPEGGDEEELGGGVEGVGVPVVDPGYVGVGEDGERGGGGVVSETAFSVAGAGCGGVGHEGGVATARRIGVVLKGGGFFVVVAVAVGVGVAITLYYCCH